MRSEEELDGALEKVLETRADAMLVLADRVFLHNRERIVSFASKNRVLCISAYRELVDAGGLMSFGPRYATMHRQAARYVNKIITGTNPAELPIRAACQIRVRFECSNRESP